VGQINLDSDDDDIGTRLQTGKLGKTPAAAKTQPPKSTKPAIAAKRLFWSDDEDERSQPAKLAKRPKGN
jgi:hypothetical protein